MPRKPAKNTAGLPEDSPKAQSPISPALVELKRLVGQKKAILEERWHEVEDESDGDRHDRLMATPEAWR